MADQIVRWAADAPPAQKLELRAAAAGSDSPGTIVGPVVVYGDVASLAGGVRETIAPGAFGNLAEADVIAHYFHDRSQPLGRTNGGGLTLMDSDEMLWAELVLPNTQRGRDVATEVRAGILQGYSSEFLPGAQADDRDECQGSGRRPARHGRGGHPRVPAVASQRSRGRRHLKGPRRRR